MSIIEKMTKIINDGDVAAGEQMIHDDYQFLMHSSGNNQANKIFKMARHERCQKRKVRVLLKMMKLDLNMLLQLIVMATEKLL